MNCCETFEKAIEQGIIRNFMGKYMSDVTIYQEDKSMLSDIYKIRGMTLLLYLHCPYCGADTKEFI